ncbi:MAG: hypothetical protein AAFP03_17305, partial [Cyanobacteria bacterium J06598_3]
MTEMTLVFTAWLRLVPLVALLWGLPAEADAKVSRRDSFNRGIERRKAIDLQLLRPIQQPLIGQISIVKQNDSAQEVLLNVEGELTEGDEQLNDKSRYDIHVFEGRAEQIVRITLTSSNFDTVLGLVSLSGEELARNDDG